jgi:ABC-type branched-subunit amino acid transport system substrate-binding protein
VAGAVTGTQGATAGSVTEAIADAACPVLVWTGEATTAASVLSRDADRPSIVVGPSRVKTDDGLALATSGVDVLTVCACADVTLTLDPILQRFIHDLQAESGSPPGPFAVEAYDAGRLLATILANAGGDDLRAVVGAALVDPGDLEGLAGRYRFEPDGSRPSATIAAGTWRAAGSRWLPVERSTVAPG